MDDETSLVIRLSQGDETALRDLFDRLSRQVFSLALEMLHNHQDAEEVLQDTFVKLFTQNGFNPQLGSARAYIYTIARNECLMRLRAKGSRPHLSDADCRQLQRPRAHRREPRASWGQPAANAASGWNSTRLRFQRPGFKDQVSRFGNNVFLKPEPLNPKPLLHPNPQSAHIYRQRGR
jgi:RNA polymerase sigma factor (sigma-70 family)